MGQKANPAIRQTFLLSVFFSNITSLYISWTLITKKSEGNRRKNKSASHFSGVCEVVWSLSIHGKPLDGVGSGRATIKKKIKTIAFISAEIFLGGIFNIFIIFQKFQMQSGKPNHYPKFSKLHQFVYIIEPHHQKKVSLIRESWGISLTLIYVYINIYTLCI